MIYSTLCPGCNLGCRLYIRGKEIDFMKSSLVNAGKLCRFGIKLPSFYTPVSSRIDNKEVTLEEAAQEARKSISENTGFLSFGNTTCEEHLAFQKIAESLNLPLYTGVDFSAFPEDTFSTLAIGIPYNEIEESKRIVLFIDPYEQYPLILRRLLSAKKKGASITSVWWKDLPVADENVEINQLYLDENSLIIADFHPFSDVEQVKSLLALAKNSNAKITFLKPFANSTGAYLLSKNQRSLEQLIHDIEEGIIKTLFCLESDASELLPSDVLNKLESIIVQTGRESRITKKARVVIASEPLYKKKGTLINSEGRAQALDGESNEGLKALGIIANNTFEFADLHEEVRNMLGFNMNQCIPRKQEYKAIEAKPSKAKGTLLVRVHNPFMWFGVEDDNDFVEISMNMVKQLKLLKGGSIKIRSDDSYTETRFKVSEVRDNVLLTYRKLGIEKAAITRVEVMR